LKINSNSISVLHSGGIQHVIFAELLSYIARRSIAATLGGSAKNAVQTNTTGVVQQAPTYCNTISRVCVALQMIPVKREREIDFYFLNGAEDCIDLKMMS